LTCPPKRSPVLVLDWRLKKKGAGQFNLMLYQIEYRCIIVLILKSEDSKAGC